jgi:type I restriction enzyme M protein
MKDDLDEERLEKVLMNVSDKPFFNKSEFDLVKLTEDANNIELNFNAYLNGFSKNVRKIIKNFNLDPIIEKLADNDLLFQLVDKMTEVDFHPKVVSNHEMGMIFEELLRRFSEMSNETAGEHYTPREVVELMVSLLLAEHKDGLQGKGLVRSVYDPACGTGGMLTTAKNKMLEINPDINVKLYGQELNDQTYAIAKSDFLITGEKDGSIEGPSSSFSDDRFKGHRFNFMLSNPPYGVSWKKEKTFIKNEENDPNGRFHAGTPRISDGSLLFLQHMISKMENEGSRITVIFNGSPLFTGDAGSGESDIRKWIIENDMLEAIIALPDQMFFNTGISTYIWLVTNRKAEQRKGKVQMVNAVDYFTKMRKSLGNKRNYITLGQIAEIVDLYAGFEEHDEVKIFDNADLGYTKVRVEQPLTDENGKPVTRRNGDPKPDTDLRDYERIPLKDDVDEYFEREVRPHVSNLPAPRPKEGEFCTYVLECSNGSFYKGHTDNIERRLKQHKKGEVSWTSKYLPVKLIHWEVFKTRKEAIKREKDLKTEFGRKWLKREYKKKRLACWARQAGAWLDENYKRIGYEINFTKYFYKYEPLRSLEEITQDLLALEKESEGLFQDIIETEQA